MKFRLGSFRNKIIFNSIVGSITAMLFAAVVFIAYDRDNFRQSFSRQILSQVKVISKNAIPALEFNVPESAEKLLSTLDVVPEVIIAKIFQTSSDGYIIFASYESESLLFQTTPDPLEFHDKITTNITDDILEVVYPIKFEEDLLGFILIQASLSAQKERTYTTIYILIITGLIAIAIATIMAHFLQKTLTTPINKLIDAHEALGSGDLTAKADIESVNEVAQLANSFNAMVTQIREEQTERKRAEADLLELNNKLEHLVDDRTKALQKTLDDLNYAQDQLIESEKMASLSDVVAGVAHEINTPIGIGITASSALRTDIEQLKSAFLDKTLTRSTFEGFSDKSQEYVELILSNLNRAAHLVESFKQIAVDQSTDSVRDINFKDYINEILYSLSPLIRKNNVNVEFECQNITIKQTPGDFYHIINNLITNSITHGFSEQKDNRNIFIYAELTGDSTITMQYKDNGKGIELDNSKHIYEPFYTTNRKAGNTGLGMSLVYNLVTRKLGGNIKLDSHLGEGVLFTITFPTVSTHDVTSPPLSQSNAQEGDHA